MSGTRSISTAQTGSHLTLEKIEARVFCHETKGGNPVTIFASPQPLTASIQQELAKGCDWESVMVGTDNSLSSIPTMSFFMPSGEEVSFCAHAAIGGAIAMGGNPGSWHFKAVMTGETFQVDTKGGGDDDPAGTVGSFCCLHMNDVRFEEAPLCEAGVSTLEEWSNKLGWSMNSFSEDNQFPKNASVARHKTLVELESVNAVHNAGIPPSDGSFAEACVTMDDSTGVYLYAPRSSETNAYECRQFPRSSGYPEDPATGIAAAALAASLRFGEDSENQWSKHERGSITKEVDSMVYNIYQGTAMGRPSLIQVMNLEKDDSGKISFRLQGSVQIDSTSTLDITD